MLLSESYKRRLRELAGLKPLDEAMDMATKKSVMDKSSNRTKFDPKLIIQAIEQGKEIGINFQSNNEKYKMPTVKARIIWPVAMGIDKKGDLVIRGYHITGQSEKKAIETGARTAEAENEWRLFKVKNIKSMWFTDRNFLGPLPGYNPRDSAMRTVTVYFDPSKAKRFQDQAKKNEQPSGQDQETTV